MKVILKIVLLLTFSISCKSGEPSKNRIEVEKQMLTDEHTAERDKIFYQLQCGNNKLSLKRILKKGKSFSIRKGREILVAIDDQGDIVYEFENIDGYSSLFLESAKFDIQDINSDGIKELIIEIEPFESSNMIWVYQFTKDCELSYIDLIIANAYEISNNELIIQTNAVCTYWDDYVEFESVLGRLNTSMLDKLDYYELVDSKFVNVNSRHTKEIEKRISGYKKFLELLTEQESKEDPSILRVHKHQYSGVRERLTKVIENYLPRQ